MVIAGVPSMLAQELGWSPFFFALFAVFFAVLWLSDVRDQAGMHTLQDIFITDAKL
jgi:hypothetical protein